MLKTTKPLANRETDNKILCKLWGCALGAVLKFLSFYPNLTPKLFRLSDNEIRCFNIVQNNSNIVMQLSYAAI